MRFNTVIYFPWIAFLILGSIPGSYTREAWRRDDITTAIDDQSSSFTSTDGSTPTSASTQLTASTQSTSTDVSTSASSTLSTSVSATEQTITTASSSTTPISTSSADPTTSSTSLSSNSSTTSSAANATSTAAHHDADPLPLQPRITPAFGIGGIILILTGITYALIGVKNRWVHTFLSVAYLASLSITVLIIYVMSPPISDAVQGGYLVGIVMTGLIFGAGALIFKEVTEGLGCLLGGFCLSMWLLTVTRGGLITNSTGKGIFVGCFCAIFWSLSFSHYTRAYGLIASTAFSGATALVLGIDCFSRAGLKEFWVYVWDLNDNLFPIGTSTYPITRGDRVESIVILLATIIGVMSQIKLWKIVRDKQSKREEAAIEEKRRQEAVEQALGRHIERHNDKDRAMWERQYGNNAPPQRKTIPWINTVSEKGYAHIVETPGSSCSSPSDSVEMTAVPVRRSSTYSNKPKRLTSVAEDVIPEEPEDSREGASKSITSQVSPHKPAEERSSSDSLPHAQQGAEAQAPTDRDGTKSDAPVSIGTDDRGAVENTTEQASKRLSLHSMLSFSPRPGVTASESQETLVKQMSIHSRPSSIAATLDEDEGDVLEPNLAGFTTADSEAPQVVVAPHPSSSKDLIFNTQVSGGSTAGIRSTSPLPPTMLDDLDDLDDPEELTREPVKTEEASLPTTSPNDEKEPSQQPKLFSGGRSRQHSDAVSRSLNLTTKTSSTEALTPDALNHVPSQISTVVTSYRTNEWAKHITAAEAPMFDEPEVLKSIDAEPPTQLGLSSPTSPIEPTEPTEPTEPLETVVEQPQQSTPDPLPPLATSTTADGVVVVNTEQAPLSPNENPETEEMTANKALPSTTSSSQSGVQREAVVDPSTSGFINPPPTPSSRAVTSKAKRTPATPKQVLAAQPITEGVPASFTPATGLSRQSSTGVLDRTPSSSSLALASRGLAGVTRPGTSQGKQTVSRSFSATNLNDQRQVPMSPSGMPAAFLPAALRSETRLTSYESRQPQQQQATGGDLARRQSLLAEWRISQKQNVALNSMPLQHADSRRAQMLLDKEQKKAREEQQRIAHQRQQLAMDQLSRRPDMQDAHREAMRKMQAKTKV